MLLDLFQTCVILSSFIHPMPECWGVVVRKQMRVFTLCLLCDLEQTFHIPGTHSVQSIIRAIRPEDSTA